MTNEETLQGRKVLVTGATGFIGGRLAERLARDEGAIVTGTGRSLDKANRLRDAGVDLQYAELLDFARIGELVAGQDVVFDVAAWLGPRHGGREMAWPLNVYATLVLLRKAAAAGVSRVVHVSSMAAYGPPGGPRQVVDEGQPVDTEQEAIYGSTKAEGEQKALALAQELGLELSVVRPGMVYGPRSYSWSLRMVQLLQQGIPVIFGDGDGYAYPVYIDNLVDGMILAATRAAAAGEAFQFVDEQPTWREWFGYYAEMCDCALHQLPLWVADTLMLVGERLPLGLSVDRKLMAYYTSKTEFPTSKAERLLGYRQSVPIAEGMSKTEAWLKREGYI